jgi:MFS family permease
MRKKDPTSRMILIRRGVSSFTYATIGSFLYIYYERVVHLSIEQIGMLFASLLAVNQCFSLISGIVGDRFGAGKIMILGCTIDALSYVLLVLTQNFLMAMVSMIGIAVGGSLFSTNARAVLLELSEGDVERGSYLQGQFLMYSNLGAFLAPILAYVIIHKDAYALGIWFCAATEILLLILLITNKQLRAFKFTSAKKISFSLISQTLTKQFLKLHFLAMIPCAISSTFPILVPFIFGTTLNKPEHVSIAFFINGLLLVLLQNWASSTFLLRKWTGPALYLCALLMVVSVAASVVSPSMVTGYLTLVIFTLGQLICATLVSNALVTLDRKENRALTYGVSKMFFAVTSSFLLNRAPVILSFSFALGNHAQNMARFILPSCLLLFVVLGGLLLQVSRRAKYQEQSSKGANA